MRGVSGVFAGVGAGRAHTVRGVGAYAVRVAKCGVVVRIAEHVVAECASRNAALSFPLSFPRAKSDARCVTFHLVAFPMRCMRRKHVAMSRNLFLPRLVTKQYVSLSSACNGAFRLKLTNIHAGRGDFIHACVHKNCSLVTFKAFIVGFQLTPTLCKMKNFVLPSHRIS